MWFIKDHLGKESGPYEFDELLNVLSTPPYKENATLVRSGRHEGWKPALIVFPEIYSEPERQKFSALHQPVVDQPTSPVREESKIITSPGWSSSSTKFITSELNRIRVVLPMCTLSISLLVTALFTKLKAMMLSGNQAALSLTNFWFICIIFFMPALTILLKILSYRTKATAESIQYSLSLYRRLFSTLCIAAVLCMGFILIVTVRT